MTRNETRSETVLPFYSTFPASGVSAARNTLTWKIGALELRLVGWWARHGLLLLRLALGVAFFWFGVQKFFPGVSVAQDFATHTISVPTFGHVPPNVSLPVLATWECLIGLCCPGVSCA